MFYSDDIIEEVRQRNDIVDVVSSYVRLQKKGSNYFGLCPFHNEKSPSFSVSPQKQMYYCFGCGAGGNVVTFVMEYENETFPEALKTLAERGGVTLPEKEISDEDRRQMGIKSALLEIHKKAAQFYYYQLTKSTGGQNALQYLTERGLSRETISAFGLGYSPMYSDALYRYLKQEQYSDGLLKQSGLFVMNEKGVYDRFWNRVMFPIMDKNNKVIAFGGRVMGQGEPKYLNSPETPIFDKSRNLYGLHEAKHSRKSYMLVCEGYMDVISLHQAGFTNAVASLGTALTSQHALLLKRYTQDVVLTYDSDGAGVQAAMRAIPILRETGIRTKVLSMKPYKDPDEFIKNLGAEAYEERIKEAENSFMFEVLVNQQKYDMQDPEQKTRFQYAVGELLVEIPDEVERNNYMEAVSGRFMIPMDILKKLVFRLSNQASGRTKRSYSEARESNQGEAGGSEGYAASYGKRKKDSRGGGIVQAERLLLAWIAEEPQIYHYISAIISPEDFSDDISRKIAELLFAQAAHGEVNPAQILNQFVQNEEEYKNASVLFFSGTKEDMQDEQREQILNDTIKKMKKNNLDMRSRSAASIEELQKLIAEQKKLEGLYIRLS